MSDIGLSDACPQCGVTTSLLHPIDQGMRLRLEKEGAPVNFDSVCTNCFKEFSKGLSSASLLQVEEKMKANHKHNLWNNRLALVRQGRYYMDSKSYADAAMCYEKYMKVIEKVFGKTREELSAELFKDNPREVTIISAALWSLVEIYDLNQSYWDRQELNARKLGEMVTYTNLFSSMVKQAQFKRKVAQNPRAYKLFLKAANVKAGKCFIATAALGDHDPHLRVLRAFRDQVLAPTAAGRFFIHLYYRWSPALAYRLQFSGAGKFVVRGLLRPIALCLKGIFNLKIR